MLLKLLNASRVDPVLSEEMLASAQEGSYNTRYVYDILVQPISPIEVLEALKQGKSPGPDGLLSEHIMYGGTTLIPWLTKVFDRIITIEEVPSCMKVGHIVPIYKRKGKDPLLASIYRGSTILPVLSKLGYSEKDRSPTRSQIFLTVKGNFCRLRSPLNSFA